MCQGGGTEVQGLHDPRLPDPALQDHFQLLRSLHSDYGGMARGGAGVITLLYCSKCYKEIGCSYNGRFQAFETCPAKDKNDCLSGKVALRPTLCRRCKDDTPMGRASLL